MECYVFMNIYMSKFRSFNFLAIIFLSGIIETVRMADFFEEVEKAFDTRCFYTVLGLDKENCDEKSIKKAYYKQSLLCHPDRCISEQQKESSKLKFQILTKIHSVLSNKEHKAVYDETGQLVDEGDLCQQNKDWEAYWRILYKKVLKSDIEEFEKEYKGSEEEAEVVRNCYVKFEGNMESILDNVMCATIDDEERFRKIIQEGIKKKKLPKFDAYSNESGDKKNKRKKAVSKNKFHSLVSRDSRPEILKKGVLIDE